MNFNDILKSILSKFQNEEADNIRFIGYNRCYVKNSKSNVVKESSPIFVTKEEYQNFLQNLFHDYPLDTGHHPLVKRHVNFNGYCFICTGINSLLTDNNEDLLYIRLVQCNN